MRSMRPRLSTRIGRAGAAVRPRAAGAHLLYAEAETAQRNRERIGERRLRDDILQVHAEVNDGLGNLRANAADDAIGAHQARGGDRLEQVLRHERIHRRHAGDVDDGDPRPGIDNALQQVFHHDLRARAVERADERQGQHAVPELDDGSRELHHLLLLPHDELFAPFLMQLGRVETELVEQRRHGPGRLGQRHRILGVLAAYTLEERLFEREDEHGRLRGRQPEAGARLRQVLEHAAHLVPLAAGDIVYPAVLHAGAQHPEEIRRLLLQLALVHQVRAFRVRHLRADPFAQDVGFVAAQQFGDVRLIGLCQLAALLKLRRGAILEHIAGAAQ